jgi:hypothetical protein
MGRQAQKIKTYQKIKREAAKAYNEETGDDSSWTRILELADAMLAEYRAFEEYYRFRNADPETLQQKLEAWWAAVKQRGLPPS